METLLTVKTALLRYLRRHDAEMHTDPPTDRPVDLASEMSGLELSCDWYRATARRGEYSLSNAVVDTGAYTVECLLGVVELEYQTGSDTFTIDADQLTVLELKCRQTSKASSSGMHLRAWPRAALSSTSQKVCSHGR